MQSGIPVPRRPAAEAKSPGLCDRRRVDLRHQLQVPDLELWTRAIPSVDARERWRSANAQDSGELRPRGLRQLGVGALEHVRIARAAQERAQQGWPAGARCGHFDEIHAPAVI